MLVCAALAWMLAGACVMPAGAAEDAGPKVVRKGGVALYPEEKRIEINGRFCLAEGPIELLACAAGGKEYESIIALDVNPEILHFCLLLLKLKPGDKGPEFQGDPEHMPSGSPVTVKVRWKDANGAEKSVPAEELCWNNYEKRTMEPTPWVFSGSRMVKDPNTGNQVYWANVDKSVIVVYRDPFSVLDLPTAASANDEAFVVNKQVVPPVGTACTVILEPGPPIPPAPKNAQGGSVRPVDVTAGGRILLGGQQPAELMEPLKQAQKESPKDTFKVTISHGAPAASIAAAFEALDGAAVRIESVEMVRVRPEVQDIAVVAVRGDKVTVDGKGLSGEQVAEAVRSRVEKGKEGGVAVKVEAGASLKTVVGVLRALGGVDGAMVRVVWFDSKG